MGLFRKTGLGKLGRRLPLILIVTLTAQMVMPIAAKATDTTQISVVGTVPTLAQANEVNKTGESNEFIVQFLPGTSPEDIQQSLAKVDGSLTSRLAPNGPYLIEHRGATAGTKVLAYLQSLPQVAYAEPNYRLSGQESPPRGAAVFKDPMRWQQWALSEIDAKTTWDEIRSILEADQDAQPTVQRKPVVIGLIDSGVDADHEDLSGRILPGRNFVDVAKYGTTDTADVNGHGTHIAGTIAALAENGIGTVGVNGSLPVRILPAKVLNDRLLTNIFDVAAAIRWSVDWRGEDGERVQVINLSLGARLGAAPRALVEAVQYALNRGVLVVAAAGNGTGKVEKFYPAAIDGVLSVGAYGKDHRLLDLSNTGADLVVPGEKILSTAPGNGYTRRSGTSFAAPIVAAAAALLWMAKPELKTEGLVEALSAGARSQPCEAEVAAVDATHEAASCYDFSLPTALAQALRPHPVTAPTSLSNDQTAEVFGVGPMVGPTVEPTATADASKPLSLTAAEAVSWPEDAQLTASNLGARSVYLEWTPAAGSVSNYRFYASSDRGGDLTMLLHPLKTDLHSLLLLPDANYTFKIEALDSDGNETGNGPQVQLQTKDKPTWPDGAKLEVTNRTAGSVTLTWPIPIDRYAIDGYYIYQGDGDEIIKYVNNDRTSATITGLSSNQTYSFRIAAWADWSYLGISGIKEVESEPLVLTGVGTDNTPPDWAATPELKIEAVGSTWIKLSWPEATDNASGVVEYEVVYSAEGGPTSEPQRVSEPGAEIQGLLPGTTYTFTVQAVDGVNNRSENGPSAEVATLADKTPPNWGDESTLEFEHIRLTWVELKWSPATDEVSEIDHYEIIYAPVGGSAQTVSVSGSSGSAKVEGLEPETSYIFTVQAVDGSGNKSDDGPSSQVSTDLPAPGNVDWTATTDSVTLTWIGHPDATNYTISREDEEIGQVANNPTNEYTYTDLDPDLAYATEYTYEITAINSEHDLRSSATVTVSTAKPDLYPVQGLTAKPYVYGVYLSWSPPDEAPDDIRYAVFRDGIEVTSSFSGATDEQSEVVSYYLDGKGENTLEPATTYEYEVRPFLRDDPNAVAFFAGVSATTLPAGAGIEETALVSEAELGCADAEAGCATKFDRIDPAISGDGRYVTFISEGLLLPFYEREGLFSSANVYLKDLLTGKLSLISMTADGKAAGRSESPSISADGRYIAFVSRADLLGLDTKNTRQVYVYDTQHAAGDDHDLIRIVSLGHLLQPAAKDAAEPQISGDGRYVAFTSAANNLTPDDSSSLKRLFVHDLTTGRTVLISKALAESGGIDTVDTYAISPNGRFVVMATATTAQTKDVYLHDRDHNENAIFDEPGDTFTELIVNGTTAWNKVASITDSGITTLISTERLDQGEGRGRGTTNKQNVYVYDPQAYDGSFQAVSLSPEGLPGDGNSAEARLNANGRYVVFSSHASNLIPGDTNGVADIFVYDRIESMIRRLSLSSGGEQGNDASQSPTISANGSMVAYASAANNLGEGDNNERTDIFVTTRGRGAPTWPSPSLTVLNVGQTFLTLTWSPAQDDAGVTAYRVYRQDESRHLTEVRGNQRSYTATDLDPDQEYTFLVQARNDAGIWSHNGPKVKVHTKALVPGEAELQATALPNGNVGLTWDIAAEDSGIIGYRIYRMNETEDTPKTFDLEGRDSGTYTDQESVPNTQYVYEVRGLTETGGEVPHSQTVEVTTISLALSTPSVSFPRFGPERTYAGLGSTLRVGVEGSPQAEVTATLHYLSWYDEADRLLSTPIEATAEISLKEQSAEPGVYKGNHTLQEGTFKLVSVTATLKDEQGREITSDPLQMDTPVTGAIELKLTSMQGSDLLNTARVVAWSDKTQTGKVHQIAGTGDYPLATLVPADDYNLQVLYTGTEFDFTILGAAQKVKVTPGLVKEVQIETSAPAAFMFRLNYDGSPVKHARVVITDATGKYLGTRYTDDQGQSYASSTWSLEGSQVSRQEIGNLLSADLIRLEVSQLSWPLRNGQVLEYELPHAGNNEPALTLAETLPIGTIEGTITGPKGQPIQEAKIAVTEEHPRRNMLITRWATSNSEGFYRLQASAGTVVLKVTEGYDANYAIHDQTFTLDGGVTLTKDLQVQEIKQGHVQIGIETKYIGSEWQQSAENDGRVFTHYGVSVQSSRGASHKPYSNPAPVFGIPGDEVRVCMHGSQADLPDLCETAELDEAYQASVTLKAEQTGGRIKGQTLEAETSKPIAAQVKVYRLDENNQRSQVRGVYARESDFDLWIPEAGSYVVVAEAYQEGQRWRGERPVEVVDDTVIEDFGIQLQPPGRFSGTAGNSIGIGSNLVTAGQTVTLRAQYTLSESTGAHVKKAVFKLGVPSGTSYLEGSLVYEGEQVKDAVLDLGMLQIPLGDVDPGQSGVARYSVEVDPSFAHETFSAYAEISFEDGNGAEQSEVIASGEWPVPGLTLTAPSQTAEREITVKGQSMPDSTIEIYADNGSFLGFAQVSPGGYWQTRVTLPDQPGYHTLSAQTERGRSMIASEPATIFYNADLPELTWITMSQKMGGRLIGWDPRTVPEFPYVVVPGDTYFELSFSDPEAVTDVWVGLDGSTGGRADAALDRDDGVHRATIKISNMRDLGEVVYGFQYRDASLLHGPSHVIKRIPLQTVDIFSALNSTEDNELTCYDKVDITDANGINFAASLWGQWCTKEVTEDAADLPTPKVVTVDGEQVHIYGLNVKVAASDRVEVEMDPFGNYPPSYLFDYSQSKDPNPRNYKETLRSQLEALEKGRGEPIEVQMEVSALIPEADLPEGELASRTALDERFAGTEQTELYGASKMKLLFEGFTFGLQALDGPALLSSDGPSPLLDRLSNLTLKAMALCNDEAAKRFQAQADDIARSIAYGLGVTGVTVVVGATIGTVGTPVGTAAGAVAGFALGEAVGWFLDEINERNVKALEDELQKAIDNEDECDQPQGTPAGAPHWILDPSGYVYEVEPSNRLEGVTTTALFRDKDADENDPWTVWDAEWYGQANPMATDGEGRYGWDVPVGRWKVAYQKPGYLTTYSTETYGDILVPPPHFDVNVPLVSLQPPVVEDVQASLDEGIVVELNRHVRVGTVTPSTFTVSIPGESEPLSGTLSFPGELAYTGADQVTRMVSRTIRFQPETPLVPGQTYEVAVTALVQSYAGIPLADDCSRTIEAAADEVASPGAPSQSSPRSQAVETPIDTEETTATIRTAKETALTSADGKLTITIPAGATEADATVTITPVVESEQPIAGAGLFKLGNRVYEVLIKQTNGDYILEFGVPLALTFDYDRGELPTGTTEDDLQAFYWDEGLGAWILVASERDPVTGTITANVNHLTLFAILAAPGLKVPSDLKNHWAQTEVLRLVSLGIVEGFEDGTYRPEGIVTRAQFAKLLVEAVGLKPEAAPQLEFTDAIPDWAAGYIFTAVGAGLVTGFEDGTFRADEPIRREQLAVMMARAIRSDAAESSLAFADAAAVSAWATAGVSKVVSFGIVTGFADNTFRPQATATRAEVATIVARFVSRWASGS